MCDVCKSAKKCEHPWAQCMASRGDHCSACGHDSWAPRRPSAPPTATTLNPKGLERAQGGSH
jgi:hypothetical protein